MTTLIRNAIVVTFGDPCHVFENGAVLIRDGQIQAVGPQSEVANALSYSDAPQVIDASGALVTPGLVNAHMHFYSTFACGYAAKTSRNFRQILENLWWPLDRALWPDAIRLAICFPALRSLLWGVTTVFDHHASYGFIGGSLGLVAAVARGLGLRVCLAFEVSDRWGQDAAEAAISENIAFIESLKSSNDQDLKGLFGLHASFTLTDKTLSKCAEKGCEIGFHVHCAEDIADVEDAQSRGFLGAVDRLRAFGILGPKTIAAHCIHLAPEEVSALAESGTLVVTNPLSNMNNAVGTADVQTLVSAGCQVGVGSDGMSANILDEARAIMLSGRQAFRDPTRLFGEAVRALTVTNPMIASKIFGRTIGILEKGAAGDAVVWDYYPPTPVTPENVGGHILFGLTSAKPRVVICSGQVLAKDFAVPGLDLAEISSEARALASKVWQKLKNGEAL